MEFIAFTPAEAGMIKNMLIWNTHKQIAELLGRSVQEIAIEAAKYAVTGVVTMEEKRPAKPLVVKVPKIGRPKITDPEKLQLAKLREEKRRNEQERLMINNKRKTERENSRRQLKSKIVDYSTQVTVRIDAKMIIYCKPGEEK